MSGTPPIPSGKDNPPPDLAIPAELTQNIPEEQRDKLIQFVTERSYVEHFSGPIPPPSLLGQYDPDVQRIIVNESVEHRLHRTTLENRGQQMYFAREILGLLFGFILALIMIVGSIQSVQSGFGVEGLIGIGGAVTGIAGTFLFADHKKRSDRKERQALQDPPPRTELPDGETESRAHLNT